MGLIRHVYHGLVSASVRERLARRRRYAGAAEFARARRTAGRGFALRQLVATICSWPQTVGARVGNVRLQIRPGTSDIRTLEQILVQRQYELPLEPRPQTILDAGANIGAAALYFAQRWPEARIAVLEPEPSNFALLQKNIQGHPSIVAVEGALWPQDGPLALANPNADKWAFRVTADQPPAGLGTIPGFSIPSLLARLHWPRIDLLKIDIEGAERELFDANTDWLANVGALMIEVHDDLAPGAMEAVQTATRAFGFDSAQSGETWWFTRPAR